MATLKAVVRKQRADGYYPVYIRIGHRGQKGYIKTDKVVKAKSLSSKGRQKEISKETSQNCRMERRTWFRGGTPDKQFHPCRLHDSRNLQGKVEY